MGREGRGTDPWLASPDPAGDSCPARCGNEACAVMSATSQTSTDTPGTAERRTSVSAVTANPEPTRSEAPNL